MAKQIINRGTNPNDGSGDSLRNGADKVNANFSEIYNILGDGTNLLNTDIDFGTNKIFYSNFVQTLTDLNNIDASKYHGLVVHVHATGALYYAHNGVWRKLLSDASGAGIASYTDSLKSVAYTGNYNDLSNRPSLAQSLTDLDITDGSAGQVLSTDGTGNFTFRDIEATTVDFNNIVNKPTTIAGYGITNAFTGRYADLIDKPVLFSGSYTDLTNKPTIPVDVSDLTDTGNLLFNGDYNSLTSLPSIPADLSDLSDNTQLLFSRSYNDLTNIPTSYSQLLSLSMSLGVTVDEFSNDTTMIDNSASALVTERAAKTYIDTKFLNLALTDLDIVDGLPGQVLTTNGAGTFTFQNPGDTIGNFTLSSSIIDTDDSSAITITPSVVVSSDLTIENDLVVRNKATVEDLVVNGSLTVSGTIDSQGAGAPEIVSDSEIALTAPTRVSITQSPFRLASFTDAERDALVAENGDMIYNTTNNRLEAFVNDAWVIVDTTEIV